MVEQEQEYTTWTGRVLKGWAARARYYADVADDLELAGQGHWCPECAAEHQERAETFATASRFARNVGRAADARAAHLADHDGYPRTWSWLREA